MRLIDIDNIPLTPIDVTDLPDDKCLLVYLKEDIDNAPTVETSIEHFVDMKQINKCANCDLMLIEKTRGVKND